MSMASANSQENIGVLDQNIPQWKRELISRRRAQTRTLPASNNTSVKLNCPSIVNAVKYPEIIAADENVTVKKQHCISSATYVASNKVPLDQADFHLRPKQLHSESVAGNMRLVEHRSSDDLTINGVGLDISIDPLKYKLKMGEEKSSKKSSVTSRTIMDNGVVNVTKNGKANENNNGNHVVDNEECQSDSSEELQYGPGIVNRLKSKYMSMTLRENQNRGVRPSLSTMRRFASLENMLDNEEETKPQIKSGGAPRFARRQETSNGESARSRRYRNQDRGRDSVKRARSVETLLRGEATQNRPRPISLMNPLVSEDLVIIESKAKLEERTRKPAEDTESPRSDLVRRTMKIFESTKSHKVSNGKGPTLAKINVQVRAPVTAPKPPLSPKPVVSLRPLSPKKQAPPSEPPPPIPERLVTLHPVQDPALAFDTPVNRTPNRSPVGNRRISSPISKPVSPVIRRELAENFISPPLSPVAHIDNVDGFPINKALNSFKDCVDSTPGVKQVSSAYKEPVDSAKPVFNVWREPNDGRPVCNTRQDVVDGLALSRPVSSPRKEPTDTRLVDGVARDQSDETANRSVSRSALENIRKDGLSVQFNFGDRGEASHMPGGKPPRSPESPQPPRQVGVIRPIMTPAKSPPPSLTDREIEKNRINRVRSTEGPDSKGLWDQKKPWNQQQNTVVFNFSSRKDPVPDYIENDGLILRGKREKPKTGDSGIILIRGASADESSTDYDDDPVRLLDPPSPCNVVFVGDNILINGRSNLLRQPKQQKLRISFNDDLTATFEYPSEASLLDETTPSSLTSPAGAALPSGPTPGIPVPLGGSSLASFTPSKVQLATENYQLGVTRAAPPTQRSPEPAQEPMEEEDYLKPAEEADTIAWSAGTAADMLF